jgi:hypothetical protein
MLEPPASGAARWRDGATSGTYQPITAFRAQAGLPEDKFVPCQKLHMGGTAKRRANEAAG